MFGFYCEEHQDSIVPIDLNVRCNEQHLVEHDKRIVYYFGRKPTYRLMCSHNQEVPIDRKYCGF
jgi:hypothetical protein